MATQENLNLAQQLYVAYYGRPADAAGLEFWAEEIEANGIEAAISAFGTSEEYMVRFGDLGNEELVNGIYQQAFGRDAEAEGLEFWTSKLESGELHLANIALEIVQGASDTDAPDASTLNNKVAAANIYTEAAGDAHSGNAADEYAAGILAGIDADTDLAAIDSADWVNGIPSEQSPSKTYTLTEIPSQTETTLYWGDIEADTMLAFLQDVAGLDLVKQVFGEDSDATAEDLEGVIESINISDTSEGSTININTADGGIISAEAIAEIGKIALLAAIILPVNADDQVTQNGIVLTPSQNNGGAFESGFTSNVDDHIVAGRPELLHGAYIDGGAGYNTLEVDMKGFFAQPFQLHNIQEVQVQNLENVYDVNQTILDGAITNFPIPNVAELTGADSLLDLSRATDLENLVITEGFNSGGDLIISGIQNYATTRLEGEFDGAVDLFYGRGQSDMLTVELANVSFNDTFSVNQNVGAVELVSEGRVNTLENVDFGGNFVELIVSGSGLLSIEDDLNFGFGEATIDASANTGGLRATISSQADFTDLEEITITGSQARDVLTVDSAADSGVLLNIDSGAGRDTIKLNAPLSAGEGSVITGENLTLEIGANADLREADVSGVDRFVLTAAGGLLLTQAQVEELGADVFVADHNSVPVLSIEVSEPDTVLSELIDLNALDSDVKLAFNVEAGASLDMTAEELHTYLVEAGVAGEGTVNISGAGLGFDPADNTAIGDGVGSIQGNFDGDLNVVRSADGFERPELAGDTDQLVIDTTDTGGVVVEANDTSDDDAFSTAATEVVIQGADDITFNVPVEMTSADFTLDFSDLTGALNDLTIRDFDNVGDDGAIIGNGAEGLRINVEIDSDVGESGVANGLESSGVEQYVVTDMAGDHTFYVCDDTQDVQVLGLQGNSGNTLTFANIPWGAVNPTILFEGDGFANWDELPKAAGNPNASSVGIIDAEYFFAGAPANVLINNQGVAPGETSNGEARPIVVDGIELTNAQSLNVTVEDGNSVIDSLSDDDSLEDATITSDFDVQLDLDNGNSGLNIDADGVAGAMTLFVEDDDVNLSDSDLAGIDAVVMQNSSALTLTIDQIEAIGAANFSVENEGDEAELNVGNYDGQAFDFSALELEGIDVNIVETLEGEDIVVDPATDFTGVGQLVITEGSNVTITAEQFEQLVASGNNAIVTEGVGDDQGTLTVDMDGDLTIGDAAIQAISSNDVLDGNGDYDDTVGLGDRANVTFDMADGETLNVDLLDLADELQVSGDEAATTKPLVNFLFEGTAGFTDTINVAGYQEVDVRILDALLDNFEVGNANSQAIEQLLVELDNANILNIYAEEVEDPTLDPRDREVVVESNAAPDGIDFEAGTGAEYVRSIVLTLQADENDAASIDGDINIVDAELREGFTLLTINTEDVDGAATGPVTIGDDAGTSISSNFLTDVVINAEVDLNITGDVIFTGDADNDTATLTLTGDADVTIKELVAGADINTVTVDTTDYTGNLNVTGGSPALSNANGDDLETLNLEGDADVTVGTPEADVAADADAGILTAVDVGKVYSWGSSAQSLHTINASAHTGALTMVLGAVALNEDGEFNFTSGSGQTTLWLSNIVTDADQNADGEITGNVTEEAPVFGEGSDVNIDLSNAAADSVVRLTDAVDYEDSAINVDLGANGELQLDGDFVFGDGLADSVGSLSITGGTLTLSGNVDFSGLLDGDGNSTLNLDGVEIVLEEGANVQMTDAQFDAFEAAGGTITGAGTELAINRDNVADFSNRSTIDLTEYRGITAIQMDEALTEDLTLTDDQAALTTTGTFDSEGVFTAGTWDEPDGADADGETVAAGNFTNISGTVRVVINSDADLTGLVAVDDFELPADTEEADLNDVALTIRADQTGLLSTTADADEVGGAGQPADILAQLSELVITGVEYENEDFDGTFTETTDVTLTADASGAFSVSAHAGALAVLQADGSELLSAVDVATFESTGTVASMINGDLDAGGTDVDSTFEFTAGAATAASNANDNVVITTFETGEEGDVLDFTAFLGEGYTAENDAAGAIATSTTAEAEIVGEVAFFESTSLSDANFDTGGVAEFADFDGQAVVVGDNGSVWYVDSDAGAGADGTVDDAGDIQLVGTVNSDYDGMVEANVGA